MCSTQIRGCPVCARAFALAAGAAVFMSVAASNAGDLNPPPGPVAPSMVTLSELDSTLRGVGAASASCPAPPEFDAFEMAMFCTPISVGPIEGDATIGGVPGLIRVASAKGARRRSGETSLGDFVVVKQSDKASPKLFLACCNGEHIPKVEVRMYRTDAGGPVEYLRYELENVLVSSFSVGSGSKGDSHSVPMEEIAFVYDKITVKYVPTGEKTSAEQTGAVQWFPPGTVP